MLFSRPAEAQVLREGDRSPSSQEHEAAIGFTSVTCFIGMVGKETRVMALFRHQRTIQTQVEYQQTGW